MTDRRSLVAGTRPPTAAAQATEQQGRQFVYGDKSASAGEQVQPRALVSTRLRADLARSLKRASLQRQLEGTEPSTLQDILEEAIEPWLRKHGYLP